MRPLQQAGCQLRGMLDCCHSGTGVDLAASYDGQTNKITVNTGDSRAASATGAYVGFISACTDAQTGADAFINKEYQGAATHAFLAVLNQMRDHNRQFTLCDVAREMQAVLVNTDCGPFRQRISCSASTVSMLNMTYRV